MSDFPEGGIPEAKGIPAELPISAIKQYVMGETITPYNFDLLTNYFKQHIINLLREDMDIPGVSNYYGDGIEYVIKLIEDLD